MQVKTYRKRESTKYIYVLDGGTLPWTDALCVVQEGLSDFKLRFFAILSRSNFPKALACTSVYVLRIPKILINYPATLIFHVYLFLTFFSPNFIYLNIFYPFVSYMFVCMYFSISMHMVYLYLFNVYHYITIF